MISEEQDSAVAIEAAAKVVEEQPPSTDIVTLSTGIKLRCKAVPQMTMRQVFVSIKKPQPPIIRNEEKGREEPWEGDPAYLQQLEDWEFQLGEVTLNVMLSIGTKVEKIPKGMYSPESDEWIEPLIASGVQPKLNSPTARYLSWLRFYAIATAQDLATLSTVLATKSGVTEADAQAALQSFRSGENGRGDMETAAQKLRGDRDNLPSANGGVGAGSGGEG